MEKIFIHKKHIPDQSVEARIRELAEECIELPASKDLVLINSTFPKELILFLWKTGIPYREFDEIILN